MIQELTIGEISIDVVFKDIKNVHLSVHPPAGRVRIAAPESMNLETIRLFAVSRLGWIKRQQRRQCGQDRETEREYLERESHYLWSGDIFCILRRIHRAHMSPLVTEPSNSGCRRAVIRRRSARSWTHGIARSCAKPRSRASSGGRANSVSRSGVSSFRR